MVSALKELCERAELMTGETLIAHMDIILKVVIIPKPCSQLGKTALRMIGKK